MSEHPLARTLLLLELDAFPGLDRDVAIETIMATRIKVAADSESLSTASGQTALIAATIALAQMGLRLTLDIPEEPLVGPQPPVEGNRLREGLTSRIGQLIQPYADDDSHDLVIAIGSAGVSRDGYRITASASTVVAERGGEGRVWDADDPSIGAIAGVLAGATALPTVIRRLEQVHSTVAPDHLRVARERVEVRLPRIALPGSLSVGDVDIISAGAITNAALFSLLRFDIEGRIRIFDDDVFQTSNLNRYPLMGVADVDQLKAHLLERFSRPGVDLVGVPERFGSGISVRLAPTVLVGADNVVARHAAQRTAPNWLHVAGTTHFEVITSAHTPDAPCAGCVHPRTSEGGGPNEIPTSSFVSLLAGTLQARALLAKAAGVALPDYYCWATNLGGESGIVAFRPMATPACPLACTASRLGTRP